MISLWLGLVQFCRSSLTGFLSLIFSLTGQCLSSNPRQGKEFRSLSGRRPVLSLVLPSKEAKQVRTVHSWAQGAFMGSESAGTFVLLTLGCETVFLPSLWCQHRSQLLPPSILKSRVRSDPVGREDWVHERPTSFCGALSFFLPFAPKDVLIDIKKIPLSMVTVLLEQINDLSEEYREYLLLLFGFEQRRFIHLYSLYVMETNGGHKALCSCSGSREKRKKRGYI